jgi:hypothetical protein
MNIYVVAEGKAEGVVYRSWIPVVNASLSVIDSVADVDNNNVYVFSAGGYPAIFGAIEDGIADVRKYPAFTRLVISADSEDLSRGERHSEIASFVARKAKGIDVRIIIQYFCLETWALGNRRIVGPRSVNPRLVAYRNLFDVRVRDPELLAVPPGEELTRAQFAEKYLRLIANDRGRGLSYSKGKPYLVSQVHFFEQIRGRYHDTGHIDSFSAFLSAFA